MLTLHLLRHLEFDEDVSFLRVDPLQPLLLMNAGHAAVRAMNIDSMSEHLVDLSDLAPEFLIYSWVVDRDGRCSLLISAEERGFGIGIDHETWTAFKFSLPSRFPHLANVCWTDPNLGLIDVHGVVWTSVHGNLVPASTEVQNEESVRRQTLLARRYAILSHDWESGCVCVLDGEANKVAVITPEGDVRMMIDGTGAEIDAAYYRGRLFVCLSEGVDIVENDQRRHLFTAPPGQQMFAIAIGRSSVGAYLAAASGSMSSRSRPRNVVDIHAIHT